MVSATPRGLSHSVTCRLALDRAWPMAAISRTRTAAAPICPPCGALDGEAGAARGERHRQVRLTGRGRRACALHDVRERGDRRGRRVRADVPGSPGHQGRTVVGQDALVHAQPCDGRVLRAVRAQQCGPSGHSCRLLAGVDERQPRVGDPGDGGVGPRDRVVDDAELSAQAVRGLQDAQPGEGARQVHRLFARLLVVGRGRPAHEQVALGCHGDLVPYCEEYPLVCGQAHDPAQGEGHENQAGGDAQGRRRPAGQVERDEQQQGRHRDQREACPGHVPEPPGPLRLPAAVRGR